MRALFPARSVILAPMAGVTDYAFREICAGLGADVTVTEMVSAKALCYGDKKTASLLRRNQNVLCGVQIFGSEPEFMARGAKLALELSGADFLDINMGCPMPKIVNNGEGSALMKDPALAARIVRAVCEAVEAPVTVKTRKGWDKGHVNVVELAQAVAEAGAAAITVHGRTRTMLYAGEADWDVIGAVKRAVSIPVIANGDVISPEAAVRCLRRSGADTAEVKKLFQTDMEHTVAMYKIMQEAEQYRSIVIAAPSTPQNRVVAAKAADQLLNISGVEASVVLSPDGKGGVFASARSIGEINVQILMEKLGGGGNRSAAAVQMEDTSLEDAVRKVHEAIDDYLS